MKNCWMILLAVMLVCGCKATVKPPASAPNPDHSITLNWQQNFADAPACSATVAKSCLNGYSEGYLDGATDVQLHTDTTAACSGTSVESCTTTFNSPLPIGAVTFYLTLDYTDSNGASQSLAPVTTAMPTQVAADAPAAFSATVQ